MSNMSVDETRYTVEELKQVCQAINHDILTDNAKGSMLEADKIELMDEYDLWARALEKKLKCAE